MRTKQTPGPWRYEKEVQTKYDSDTGEKRTWTYHWVFGADGSRAANSLEAGLMNMDNISSANAQLIAAAPTLLDACTFAIGALASMRCACHEIDGHREACPGCQARSTLDAAIANATGGTP